MPEETTNTMVPQKSRPMLITVLCVLTFIGSVLGLIYHTMGYIHAVAKVETLQSGESKTQLKNLVSSGSNAAAAELVKIGNLNVQNYEKYSIGCIASYILCLVGAVLIFKLKRTGFYSFTLGTFFNLIAHFLLFGDNFGVMDVSILVALGGLVFIILFGMNLKYLDEPEEF
jgi:hypothetical protein